MSLNYFNIRKGFASGIVGNLGSIPLDKRGDVLLFLLQIVDYCCAYETDGTAKQGVTDWKPVKEKRLAALAEDAGLVEITESGYRIPNIEEYMPTRANLERKREAARQRKARQREREALAAAEAAKTGECHGVTGRDSHTAPVTPDVTSGNRNRNITPLPPPRPVEDVTSLGDETVADVEAEEAGDDQEVVMDKFEEFWQAYPRTAGENRRKAEAIWLAICSRDPALCDVIVAAARAYAASPSRPQKTSSLPAPARWLSERRFESMPEAKARARPAPKPPQEPESEVDDGLEEIREALAEGRPLPAWWAKIPASVREAFLAKLETTQQATEPKEKTA